MGLPKRIKKRFENIITLYGRKPVLESLKDESIQVFRLHLSDSNKEGETINETLRLAELRGIEVITHSRKELSRISKNGRQDQGVAVDIEPKKYVHIEDYTPTISNLLVADHITNPQNLGMIIRSVVASPMSGILIPKKGCASIDALVHKASAGTLLKGNIFFCETIESGLANLKSREFNIFGLAPDGTKELGSFAAESKKQAFVLGNESNGLSAQAKKFCDELVKIKLHNEVDSINVAAAATLVAFRPVASGSYSPETPND